MMNKSEAEIDRIRLKLYEETKTLTKEQRIKRANDLAQQLAAQYGFTIKSFGNEKKYSTTMSNSKNN